MSNEIKLHFGGLWATVDEPTDDNSVRSAIHFFGENYLVFLSFEKPNKVIQGIFHYVLSDGKMSMQSLDQESEGANPVIEFKWRLIDDRLLELVENGKTSLWEPVVAERLAEEGYPVQLFQSLRKSFVEAGTFYSEVPLAPHPSAFAALKKRRL